MSLSAVAKSNDSPVFEETATQILGYHENDSDMDILSSVSIFYDQLTVDSIDDASLKLKSKLKEISTMKNDDITSIIEYISSMEWLVNDSVYQLKNFERKKEIKKMEKAVIQYFKSSSFISKENAIYLLLYKIQQFFLPSALICHMLFYQDVNATAAEIKNHGEQGSLEDVSNTIKEFCERYYKTIKIAASLLIRKCFDLFNEKDNGFSTFVIQKILFYSKIILTDPSFANISQPDIPNGLKNSIYRIVTHPTIKNCESEIDYLLFDGISNDAKKTAETAINLFNTNSLPDVSVIVSEFCSKHSDKNLRIAITQMACYVNTQITRANSRTIIEHILIGFNMFLTNYDNVDEIKIKIFNQKIPQYLFEKLVLILLHQNPSKFLTALDLLIHISKPDSDNRNEFIDKRILYLNGEKKLIWEEALQKIKCSNASIKIDSKIQIEIPTVEDNDECSKRSWEDPSDVYVFVFSSIIDDVRIEDKRFLFMMHISQLKELSILLRMLTYYNTFDKEQKIIFGMVPDYLYTNALKKCFELLPLLSISSWKKYSFAFDLLFHITEPESEDKEETICDILRRNIDDAKTLRFLLVFIKTFNLNKFIEKEFENILKYLEKFEMERVFLTVFSNSTKNECFTFFYSKVKDYFSMKKKTTQNKLFSLTTQKVVTYANEFIKKMEKTDIYPCYVKEVIFREKTYKCLYVDTPGALYDFFMNYLVLHIGDIGCDSETDKNQKITLLQLATMNWLCVSDVQKLLNEVSEEIWTIFFKELFGNNVIGFSFRNDRAYLCNTFPHLQELFKQTKVLCIQEITAKIIKEQQKEENKIFDDFFLPWSSLAAHAEFLLNIVLDKSEQTSDWTQRPLTDKQLNYAFIDALIPLLLKEELQKRFEISH